MSKLTLNMAQSIIDRYIAGSDTSELAKEFAIWQTTVCNIISGRSWLDCVRPKNIDEIIRLRTYAKRGRKCKELPALNELQSQILVGSLLGDGSITKSKKNSSFTKLQHKNRIDYLNWHFSEFGEYSSSIQKVYSREKLKRTNNKIQRIVLKRKRHTAYRYYSCSHPNFTEMRQLWYPNDIKTVPSNIFLSPLSIAIWYFDDGCNNLKQRIATIATNSFTFGEVEFLSSLLEIFDLSPKIVVQESKPILKFSRDSYDKLIALVSPYMLWDCYRYKIEWQPVKKQWETSGKFTEDQIKDIIKMRQNKSAKEIAKLFNVHVNTIYAIVSGRSWSHLQR